MAERWPAEIPSDHRPASRAFVTSPAPPSSPRLFVPRSSRHRGSSEPTSAAPPCRLRGSPRSGKIRTAARRRVAQGLANIKRGSTIPSHSHRTNAKKRRMKKERRILGARAQRVFKSRRAPAQPMAYGSVTRSLVSVFLVFVSPVMTKGLSLVALQQTNLRGAFTGLPGLECGEGGPTAGPQALSPLLRRRCEIFFPLAGRGGFAAPAQSAIIS
jgi:hypothetical protein